METITLKLSTEEVIEMLGGIEAVKTLLKHYNQQKTHD